jgi:multiple sugar transport system substrate-binding protein
MRKPKLESKTRKDRLRSALGALVAVTCATSGLAGLSASAAHASVRAAANSPVTISYMLWDPNQEIGYKQAVAAFEKQYSYIHVNVIQVGFSDYWTKLSTEIAAGDAPDVYWDNISNFPTYVREGALLDVTPLIKKFHINLKDYFQNLLSIFEYKGQYYSVTKDWDTEALIYNKNELKKAGLAPPLHLTWNPTTGGTLLQYAEKLTISSNGKHAGEPGFDPSKIVQYGFSAGLAGDNGQEGWSNFLEGDGVPYSNATGWAFDTTKGDQVFQFLNNLIYKWHVSPPATVTTQSTYDADTASFAPGKVAMMTDGDWDLASVASVTNFPWGVGYFPAGPDGIDSATNGLGININAHISGSTLAAAELLWAWLTNSQTETLMSKEGYIWGSMPSVDPLYVQYWAKKGVDVAPFLQEQKGKTFLLGPEVPNAEAASTPLDTELNLVFLNKVSVSSGVKSAVEQANSALSNG